MKPANILYNIFIPQEKIRKAAANIGIDSAVILDFISRFQLWSREKSKSATFEGEEYIWLHFPSIIKALPLLKIRSKARISRKIEELVKAGLLKKRKTTDNILYVRLTDLGASLYLPEELVTKYDQRTIPPIAGATVSPGAGAMVSPAYYNNIHNKKIQVSGANAPSTPSFEVSAIPRNPEKEGDPRIRQVMGFFIGACHEIKGFKPRISGAIEGRMIKNYLQEYSVEEITDELDWFLKGKESDQLGCTIKVALSNWVFNKWLSSRETL